MVPKNITNSTMTMSLSKLSLVFFMCSFLFGSEIDFNESFLLNENILFKRFLNFKLQVGQNKDSNLVVFLKITK